VSYIVLRDNELSRPSAWNSCRGGGNMAGAMPRGLNPIGFRRRCQTPRARDRADFYGDIERKR